MSFENPSVNASPGVKSEGAKQDRRDEQKEIDAHWEKTQKLSRSAEVQGADYELIVSGLQAAVENWKQSPDKEWVEAKIKNIRQEIFDDFINNEQWSGKKIRDFLAVEAQLISDSFEYAKAVWARDSKLSSMYLSNMVLPINLIRENRLKAYDKILLELNKQLAEASADKSLLLRKARLEGKIEQLKADRSGL